MSHWNSKYDKKNWPHTLIAKAVNGINYHNPGAIGVTQVSREYAQQ